jgi:hypothetical protein
VGGLLAAALGTVVAALVTGADDLFWLAMVCAFMLIPVAAVFKCPPGPVRRKMAIYAGTMGATGLVSSALAFSSAAVGSSLNDLRAFAFLAFFVMLLGSGWFANWLIMKRVPR